MSVEITKLPSGLTVVTDVMSHGPAMFRPAIVSTA